MKKLRLRYGSALKWLLPGMGIKRWLFLLFLGITILSLGAGYVLVEIYRTFTFPDFVYYLTLQFIPRAARGFLFGVLGTAFVIIAIVQLYRSLLAAFHSPGQSPLVDIIYRYRYARRGPKVVAIGGGTGLPTLLKGLKEYTSNLTAIVTVADDGGSSGQLRRELGLLPPGDFRNAISALADAESLMNQLFQYRFSEGMGLNGHSFGNLFIAAMAGVTGNFEKAILEAGKVLAIQGQIFPSTLENVTLSAEFQEEEDHPQSRRQVQGESQIPKVGVPIARVWLEPQKVAAYPGSVQAIMDADLVTVGPGSLYTSVLPNLLVPGIAEALRNTTALKLYICNVATQRGETDGFTAGDHVRVLEEHVGSNFDWVLANDNLTVQLPQGVQAVPPQKSPGQNLRMVTADMVDEKNPWRHDPKKLARQIMELYWSERRL